MKPTEYSERIDEILDLHLHEIKAGHDSKLKAAILSATRDLVEGIIGLPLDRDVSYTPTLDDPYGARQIANQTIPKTTIDHGSYETIKRQYDRLNQLLGEQ